MTDRETAARSRAAEPRIRAPAEQIERDGWTGSPLVVHGDQGLDFEDHLRDLPRHIRDKDSL